MASNENKIFSDPRLIDLFKQMQEVTQFANKPYAIRGDQSHMVISRRKPATYHAAQTQKLSTRK